MSRLPIITLLVFAVGACNENAAHVRMAEAYRLSNLLIAQFTQAVGASDRAVMADSDEAAVMFAKEAQTAIAATESTAAALGPILDGLGYSDDSRLLKEFEQRFAEYRTVDSEVLALAVQGTNAKAQRLSFGAAQETVDAMRDALTELSPARPMDSWQVKALAMSALASAREIQVLHAPHIAEPDDAAMTRMETRMGQAEGEAREQLTNLIGLIAASSRPRLSAAVAALDRLNKLNTEINTLSRRNTNVRALALSLGRKRVLATSCESALGTLQEAIARHGLPMR